MTDLINHAFTQLGPRYKEPRPIQTQLLNHLMEDRPKIALVEAPVGIGKSGLGVAYGELIESKLTTVLTATISLQEQYERDFNEMVVMKGRGNYECENGLSAAEGLCLSQPGHRCDSDYYVMRSRVLEAGRVAANYAVYLHHLFYSRLDRKPDLLVCDEGHRLLDILTQFETVSLDSKLVRKLKAAYVEGWWSLEQAKEWAERNQGRVETKMRNAIIKGSKRAKLWVQLYRQIGGILGAGGDYITLKTGEILEAAPLWPRRAAKRLFDSADKVLVQSATLYGGHILAELLGIRSDLGRTDKRAYQFYTVPSPFDPKRWSVYYRPVVALRKGSDNGAWARMADVVHDYVHRYDQVKGVIHVAARNQVERVLSTVRQCQGCASRICAPDTRLWPTSSNRPEPRAVLLQRFRSAPSGTWLCHYSMGEGESFDDDTARIQLIAKTPYPDLGDKLTRLRLDEPGIGRRMYAAQTLAKVAQISGRGMRHEEDYCETVILDKTFGREWAWHKDLAPSWFSDILEMR